MSTTGVNSKTFSIAALEESSGGGSNSVTELFDIVEEVEVSLDDCAGRSNAPANVEWDITKRK